MIKAPSPAVRHHASRDRHPPQPPPLLVSELTTPTNCTTRSSKHTHSPECASNSRSLASPPFRGEDTARMGDQSVRRETAAAAAAAARVFLYNGKYHSWRSSGGCDASPWGGGPAWLRHISDDMTTSSLFSNNSPRGTGAVTSKAEASSRAQDALGFAAERHRNQVRLSLFTSAEVVLAAKRSSSDALLQGGGASSGDGQGVVLVVGGGAVREPPYHQGNYQLTFRVGSALPPILDG